MELERDVNVFVLSLERNELNEPVWTLHSSHDRFIRIEMRERRRKESMQEGEEI